MPLPTEISLLLPYYSIVTRQPGALGLAYAGVEEARRIGLLSCYGGRASVYS